jgi:IS5 family transposase
VKVSITTTHRVGLVVGMRSTPGNPYDGRTLAEALEQAAILSDMKPEVAVVDRGYMGSARFWSEETMAVRRYARRRTRECGELLAHRNGTRQRA